MHQMRPRPNPLAIYKGHTSNGWERGEVRGKENRGLEEDLRAFPLFQICHYTYHWHLSLKIAVYVIFDILTVLYCG